MPDEKKYKRIIPHAQRQAIFQNHPDVLKVKKSLNEYYKVPDPYAMNILWWAFEVGWNSRLEDTDDPHTKK